MRTPPSTTERSVRRVAAVSRPAVVITSVGAGSPDSRVRPTPVMYPTSTGFDSTVLTMNSLMIAGQYWVTPQFWIKGGIGVAGLYAENDTYYGEYWDFGTGGALMAAAGYELLSARNFAIGVLLAIEPWNYPFYQVVRVAGPNLVLGNTVILKHAEITPQCAVAIEQLQRRVDRRHVRRAPPLPPHPLRPLRRRRLPVRPRRAAGLHDLPA